ncbi:MAG: hypothetical protein ACXAE3_02810 [Candidatus Kariarchaeaceae archaeon]
MALTQETAPVKNSFLRQLYQDCLKDRLFLIYAIGVILQTGHTIEHYAQVVQRFWLGWPAAESHGLIGQLDVEIVHFLWNSAVVAFLIWAHRAFELNNPESKFRAVPMIYGISVFNILFQSYHTFEHIIRMVQFFILDIRPAPGLLGYVLQQIFGQDGVILMHFFINLLVYPLMVVFLLIYMFHRHIYKLV